jgi:hypothetical protein
MFLSIDQVSKRSGRECRNRTKIDCIAHHACLCVFSANDATTHLLHISKELPSVYGTRDGPV